MIKLNTGKAGAFHHSRRFFKESVWKMRVARNLPPLALKKHTQRQPSLNTRRCPNSYYYPILLLLRIYLLSILFLLREQKGGLFLSACLRWVKQQSNILLIVKKRHHQARTRRFDHIKSAKHSQEGRLHRGKHREKEGRAASYVYSSAYLLSPLSIHISILAAVYRSIHLSIEPTTNNTISWLG